MLEVGSESDELVGIKPVLEGTRMEAEVDLGAAAKKEPFLELGLERSQQVELRS